MLYELTVEDTSANSFLSNLQLLMSLRSQLTLQRLFRHRVDRPLEDLIAARAADAALVALATNLVHSTPLPQLGDAVVMTLEGMSSVTIRRHYSRGFPVYDENIAPLFLLLSPRHIITVLQTLLLEGKVLLHSAYPALVTATAHIFKRLLFPWKYAGSFIPLLPSSMLLAVQVPGSFIIGVETVHVNKRGEG